ncbi:MAG TPA: outer membrane lipoprotein carrier protein LolA [Rhodocyclaceae bacterium]|nr:outer membrane lipoprotein carrier protein LolA [Rhodocyclaceae bacterium]
MRALVRVISACQLFICAQVHAQSDDLLTRIAAQLDKHAVVRAEFAQSKQISGVKRPLQTSGQLIFARQYGVLWQIDKPYKVSYILSEEKIVEITADGGRKERLARDLPGLAQVGRVFRAMLGANTSALREHFDIEAKGEAGNWSLTLNPRQAQMAQFIEQIDIGGGAFVVAIRIQERGGDATQIKFRNSNGADTLSESERQLFGGSGKQ